MSGLREHGAERATEWIAPHRAREHRCHHNQGSCITVIELIHEQLGDGLSRDQMAKSHQFMSGRVVVIHRSRQSSHVARQHIGLDRMSRAA